MTSSAHVQDTWTESGRQLLLTTRLTGNRTLFSCLHSLIYSLGEWGELSKVVQTLDCVSGLHNSVELSQPSSCLDEALLCKHGKTRFPNCFHFFSKNQNSVAILTFSCRITPLKKPKFHKKNRWAVYMLRKWALFHVSGGMTRIKVEPFFSYFWRRQLFYNFLPMQVVKTGGLKKRTV